MIKRILALLALTAFVAVLLLIPAYLYADSLYREIFDARAPRAQEQPDTPTAFDLTAQETEHQAQSRIAGWMTTVSSQETAVKTPRGMLAASQYEPVSAGESVPWAIVFHGGLGTDRAQVRDIACMLSVNGYRVLTPDLYAHGESEGDASTMGFGDAQDVHAWVDYVVKAQQDARIVLFGLDEGAVAVLSAACEGLNERVVAVAADSACNDAHARLLAVSGVREDSLNAAMLRFMMNKRAGGAPAPLSVRIAQADVPLLLIHGTGDQTVPAWHSEDIALAAAEKAKLLYIEGAGHRLSRFVEPTTYYETLLRFYETALKR